MKKIVFIITALTLCTQIFSQNDITGKWKTIDHETSEAKSYVKLYTKNGKLYGKILALFGKNKNPICNCLGDKNGKPIVGMVFIEGVPFTGKYWEKDKGIFDPERNKYYDVRIWLEGDKLKVRGYVGFLYNTQTWEKVK